MIPGGFRDPTKLMRWTVWSLYAQLALAPIVLVIGSFSHQTLTKIRDRAYASDELMMAAAETHDTLTTWLGIIQVLVLVPSGVLILMWIYRANYNARQLGAEEMRNTPGWAVGWYFIPVAFFWKPYQAMKEIWQASADPSNWKAQNPPGTLPLWWFFWIASNLIANASLRLSIRDESINGMILGNALDLVGELVSIPLSLLLLRIVRDVHRMQMARTSTVTSL
jgi:hypothetical protein